MAARMDDSSASLFASEGEFARAGTESGERYGAADAEALHKHPPTLPGTFRSSDNPVERDEDVLPPVGTILERYVKRHMTAADGYPGS